MMRILTFALMALIAANAYFYAVLSFSAVSFNPVRWDEGARLLFSFGSVVLVIITAVVTTDIITKNKKS